MPRTKPLFLPPTTMPSSTGQQPNLGVMPRVYETMDRRKRPMVWETRWQELAGSGDYADRMADRLLDRRIFPARSPAVAFQRRASAIRRRLRAWLSFEPRRRSAGAAWLQPARRDAPHHGLLRACPGLDFNLDRARCLAPACKFHRGVACVWRPAGGTDFGRDRAPFTRLWLRFDGQTWP